MGAVFEDMPQMSIPRLTLDLGAYHAGEAGPSTARLELVRRNEEGLSRGDIDVDPFTLLIPVIIVEGVLRARMLGHGILRGGKSAT